MERGRASLVSVATHPSCGRRSEGTGKVGSLRGYGWGRPAGAVRLPGSGASCGLGGPQESLLRLYRRGVLRGARAHWTVGTAPRALRVWRPARGRHPTVAGRCGGGGARAGAAERGAATSTPAPSPCPTGVPPTRRGGVERRGPRVLEPGSGARFRPALVGAGGEPVVSGVHRPGAGVSTWPGTEAGRATGPESRVEGPGRKGARRRLKGPRRVKEVPGERSSVTPI